MRLYVPAEDWNQTVPQRVAREALGLEPDIGGGLTGRAIAIVGQWLTGHPVSLSDGAEQRPPGAGSRSRQALALGRT
jgi:hypothetical protein